jgi:hypothetical protein
MILLPGFLPFQFDRLRFIAVFFSSLPELFDHIFPIQPLKKETFSKKPL